MPLDPVVRWSWIALLTLSALYSGCAIPMREDVPRASSRLGGSPERESSASDAGLVDQLELQGLVMDMADEYMTGLGEALFQAIDDQSFTPRQRRFAASIVRSGVLAAIEIGSAANPEAALLDLLVLVTLQRSAIERLWIPQEWPNEETERTVERLRRIEEQLWDDASVVLSDAQKHALRALIDDWIVENPDRRFVELVRFRDFTKTRNMPSLAQRERAQGLLRDVNEAVRAIDDARLFAERALWLSTRLPAAIGTQVEQTVFHLAGEPEIMEMRKQIETFRQYTERITAQIETLPAIASDKLAEIDDLATKQRVEMITQLSDALAAEREVFIATTFDRFAEERTATLDELERRSDTLQGILVELQETLSVTSQLTLNIQGTVDAVDRVVARFDTEGRKSEPLDMKDVRLAAVAIGEAADRLTIALDRADDALGRTDLAEVTDRLVAQMFWGLIGVVAFLLIGLALLKLIPVRATKRAQGDG